MTDVALALDIGGTKMAAALVDRRGNLQRRAQVPTPPTSGPGPKDAETLWQTLVDLVQHVREGAAGAGGAGGAASQVSIVACGVGCGGPMSPGG